MDAPQISSEPISDASAAPAAAIPGVLTARSALERYALPLVIALGALLFLLNLGGYPIYTKGESREAVTIFDIAHGGGVILPMRAGVEIPSKPLLMHWLAALCGLIGGVNPWTVRLPTALCAIGGMVVCFLYLRKLFDWRVGLLAAVMLGTSAQYVQAGGGARVDMTLTFFLEVAFFEFILVAEDARRGVWLLYLAIACAVLTKGPIGLALPGLVGGLWLLFYRRWDLLGRLKLGRGVLIVGVLGGGWYLAAIAVGGSAFVHKQLLGENLYRLIHHAGVHEPHAHPFYYEDLALLAGFLPWTPFIVLAIVQWRRAPRALDRRFGYLVIWAIAVLLFYNFPQSKRGIYLLAMYPALSGALALARCDLLDTANPEKWISRLCAIVGAVIFAAGVVVGAALFVLMNAPRLISTELIRFGVIVAGLAGQMRIDAAYWLPLIVLLPVLLLGGGLWLICARGSLWKLIGGVAGLATVAVLAVNLVVEPAIAQTLALKNFSLQVRQVAGASHAGFFGNLDYNFAFYIGRDLSLTSPLDPNGPTLLVSPEDDWKLVPPRLSERYRILLRSNPTELDGSGRMLLLKRIAN